MFTWISAVLLVALLPDTGSDCGRNKLNVIILKQKLEWERVSEYRP
jgi:hypothetical protein